MTEREELLALRRLAELEARASSRDQAAIDAANAGAVNPVEGMTPGQLFGAGMGRAFAEVGRGLKQLPRPGDLLSPDRRNAVQAEIDEARKLDAPLMETPSGMAGNITGNVAAIAPAAMIPGVNTIAGSSLLGGVAGFTQPVATDESRLMNTAAGFGAGGIVPSAVRTAQVGRSAVQPFHEAGRNQILANVLRRAAGSDAPAVQQRLAGAQELVPGSIPTAGEVSGNANIAALQRAVAQADPEAYAARAAQQNEARVAALRDLAGTDGQREFFGASRTAAAKQLYDDAYLQGVDIRRDPTTGRFRPGNEVRGIKGEITKLMKRPAMKKAIEQARILAANEGHTKLHPLVSVRGLDYTKRALDDMIEQSKARQRGNEARILTGLKDRLLTTVDKVSPKYELARKTFKDMSRPINQMDVADDLAKRAINPLNEQLQPGQFARLLSDDTVARVTGSRAATLENTLEPDQLSKLNAIKADLARSVQARDLGRGPGSNTFQNFAMANMLEQSGVPSFVRGMTIPQIIGGAAGRVGNAAYADADRLMRERLAQALLNPREAAALMQPGRQLTQQQRKLVEALRFGSAAVPIAAVNAH